jgi:hypothetical protein
MTGHVSKTNDLLEMLGKNTKLVGDIKWRLNIFAVTNKSL